MVFRYRSEHWEYRGFRGIYLGFMLRGFRCWWGRDFWRSQDVQIWVETLMIGTEGEGFRYFGFVGRMEGSSSDLQEF